MNENEIINYLKSKIDKTMPQYTVTMFDGKVYRREIIPLETNFSQETSNMVQKLIDLYQEQKQLNEVHQKINGELRIKVKELEKKVEKLENQMGKDLDVVYLKAIYDERDKWKNKIKEKIKKLETRRENEKGYKGLEYSRTGLLNAGIQVLQELLGE